MKYGCKKVDHQLLEFLTRETAAGLDRETMRAQLIKKGWKESAIEEGFAALDAGVVVPGLYIFKRKLAYFLFVIGVLVLPIAGLIFIDAGGSSSGGGERYPFLKTTILSIIH